MVTSFLLKRPGRPTSIAATDCLLPMGRTSFWPRHQKLRRCRPGAQHHRRRGQALSIFLCCFRFHKQNLGVSYPQHGLRHRASSAACVADPQRRRGAATALEAGAENHISGWRPQCLRKKIKGWRTWIQESLARTLAMFDFHCCSVRHARTSIASLSNPFLAAQCR